MTTLVMAFLALALSVQGFTESIGSQLRPGMQLVYSSGGVETPWTIDSLMRNLTIGSRTGCVRIRLRTSQQGTPETRALCADTTLLSWDDRSGELRPTRPLKAGGVLEVVQRSGGSVRFEAGSPSTERVGETVLWVLPTTVTTRDSTGRVVRRLLERFSIGLATATGGVFEVPDSTRQSGWRTVRSFELVALRQP